MSDKPLWVSVVTFTVTCLVASFYILLAIALLVNALA